MSPISSVSANAVDQLAISSETRLIPTGPKSWAIKSHDLRGTRPRRNFSPSRAAVPKLVMQKQHIASTLLDKQLTDMFARDDTLPRSPSYSPDVSLVAPAPLSGETMQHERSISSIPAVHKMKPASQSDLLSCQAYRKSAIVANDQNWTTKALANYDDTSDRAPKDLGGQRIRSAQPDMPPLLRNSPEGWIHANPDPRSHGRPAGPQNGVSQPTIVSTNTEADARNGRDLNSPPIIVPTAIKPALGAGAITPESRQRKRKFSPGGKDESASEKVHGEIPPLETSDRASTAVSQDGVQPQSEVPQSGSTANPGLRPGRRSIHDKAKVKIDLYIKDKDDTFVLWSFGKLHGSTFDDICAKVAAEYERPVASIVFHLIAGDTVTTVEIERSGDEGYQRLDQKLKEVVETCKHDGIIRINLDPQAPEDAYPSWEYDVLF
ncbi:hypothetical protein MMC18_008111 [Xylographa bjoerkii]|nr:hypothetical protein [Xylographa bjoerkii]